MAHGRLGEELDSNSSSPIEWSGRRAGKEGSSPMELGRAEELRRLPAAVAVAAAARELAEKSSGQAG